MFIMLFYHENNQNKSQVVAIDINYSGFQIKYQYMEKEGVDLESFYQSRSITQEEFNYLIIGLSKEFNEKHVPDFMIEKFENQIDVEYVEY